ncbi:MULTISPECIES: Ger(x)C family spore germination protein [Bacillus]|uniref:Ger(x)C family spore germination protein n=1 Tax=Bacillus TaxID=1386 RepID=UPI00077E4833|nr:MULTISPECIES: Ger(x)C family spore germination protein [Bacillus]AMR51930.1 spore gernimation protein GerA [Bacillus amyloliquefaciens]AWQ14919.1 Ger(x)C family spore germination protein [Bacillus velezensis]OXS82434.1 spore gernimation protein GerA [Bacillus sp. LYLB4]QGU49024.1 Ger(x)C family spore germination protein [Bacillus velezensis]UJL70707.1 Ger(x)C family spore germination protein [Bacillus velezensis]
MTLFIKWAAALFILMTLSGCWDAKEVEKLSFARGLAIDETSDRRYKLTYQNLLPQSENSQASGRPVFVNVTTRGDTILEAVSEVALKDPPVYSDHLKVLIFSDKLLADQNILQMMNHFIRDDELRRSSYLFAARGKASDILTEPTPNQQQPMAAEKLIDLTNNGGYNGKILKPLRIGRASIYCHNKLSFLIQAVSNQKGKTVYDGAAIIKNAKQNRLAGFLSSYEIQSLNWLMGTIRGGVLPALDKGGHPITFEIKKSTSVITPRLKNGKLSFHVAVKTKGLLSEDQYAGEDSFDQHYLNGLEKIFEKKLKSDVKEVIDKLQNQYETDPVFFSDRVRIQYPDYWKKVKHHWDETFSEAAFDYDVSIQITNFGTMGR